jgi:hypothetical protein
VRAWLRLQVQQRAKISPWLPAAQSPQQCPWPAPIMCPRALPLPAAVVVDIVPVAAQYAIPVAVPAPVSAPLLSARVRVLPSNALLLDVPVV